VRVQSRIQLVAGGGTGGIGGIGGVSDRLRCAWATTTEGNHLIRVDSDQEYDALYDLIKEQHGCVRGAVELKNALRERPRLCDKASVPAVPAHATTNRTTNEQVRIVTPVL
jgi:hypothetical protein